MPMQRSQAPPSPSPARQTLPMPIILPAASIVKLQLFGGSSPGGSSPTRTKAGRQKRTAHGAECHASLEAAKPALVAVVAHVVAAAEQVREGRGG